VGSANIAFVDVIHRTTDRRIVEAGDDDGRSPIEDGQENRE